MLEGLLHLELRLRLRLGLLLRLRLNLSLSLWLEGRRLGERRCGGHDRHRVCVSEWTKWGN